MSCRSFFKERDPVQSTSGGTYCSDSGQADGKQFQLGDYVALLDGQVVAVTGDLDAVLRAPRASWPQTLGTAWSLKWRRRLRSSFAEDLPPDIQGMAGLRSRTKPSVPLQFMRGLVRESRLRP